MLSRRNEDWFQMDHMFMQSVEILSLKYMDAEILKSRKTYDGEGLPKLKLEWRKGSPISYTGMFWKPEKTKTSREN